MLLDPEPPALWIVTLAYYFGPGTFDTTNSKAEKKF
jgi:hypothetical protein